MKAETQTQEHKWLQQLLGEWSIEADCNMGPDQPSVKSTGAEVVRSLGDHWALCDGKGEMPGGGSCATLMTLGYDPQRKRFVGTFIASMMTHLWVYDGELDAAGKVLTLNTEGPSMAGDGKMTKYKDVIEFKNNDHRVMTSHGQGADGKWTPIMTAHYRRRK